MGDDLPVKRVPPPPVASCRCFAWWVPSLSPPMRFDLGRTGPRWWSWLGVGVGWVVRIGCQNTWFQWNNKIITNQFWCWKLTYRQAPHLDLFGWCIYFLWISNVMETRFLLVFRCVKHMMLFYMKTYDDDRLGETEGLQQLKAQGTNWFWKVNDEWWSWWWFDDAKSKLVGGFNPLEKY